MPVGSAISDGGRSGGGVAGGAAGAGCAAGATNNGGGTAAGELLSACGGGCGSRNNTKSQSGRQTQVGSRSTTEQALPAPSPQQDLRQIVIAANADGINLLRRDEPAMAFEQLKWAESVLVANPDLSVKEGDLLALTCSNLGCYYKKRGLPRAALHYLERAMKAESTIAHEQQDISTVATTKLNACAALSRVGRHEEAERLAVEATQMLSLRAEPTAEECSLLAVACHNLGAEREHLGRWAAAAVAYRQGSEVANKALGPKNALTRALAERCGQALGHAEKHPMARRPVGMAARMRFGSKIAGTPRQGSRPMSRPQAGGFPSLQPGSASARANSSRNVARLSSPCTSSTTATSPPASLPPPSPALPAGGAGCVGGAAAVAATTPRGTTPVLPPAAAHLHHQPPSEPKTAWGANFQDDAFNAEDDDFPAGKARTSLKKSWRAAMEEDDDILAAVKAPPYTLKKLDPQASTSMKAGVGQ